MSPVHLGTIILISFLFPLLFRPLLHKTFIERAGILHQPRRSFILDFSICIMAGILMNAHNYFRYDLPFIVLLSPMIGCIIAGLFIGLDSALSQEKRVILRAIDEQTIAKVPKKFFSVTQKFTTVAVTASVFVAIVIILVFLRDIEWLAANVQSATAVQDAAMIVVIEVLFIMGVLTLVVVNLIFSYSRNLKLLFNNETKILEKVSNGDLSSKVPIATRDEFGFIAGHTNHMIDGLRHRFKLIHSLKLAEEVQQNLLPDSSPYLKGFDISGTSIYCEQTGGDYYDYLLLPNNSIGIVVADAIGHGVGAAMLMTSVRAFITSAVKRYTTASTLVSEVNHYISNDCSKSGRFTSMFFMEVTQGSKSISWVRAGHEPPLLYHAQQGEFSELEQGNLVLGIDNDHEFEEFRTEGLEQGDIIFIGTDGISEASNFSGEQFGKERIKNCLLQAAQKPAKQIQEDLLAQLSQFSGDKKQEDDITLVIIKIV